MSRFASGKYTVIDLKKYVGKKTPTYRSSWELQFMRFCDTHPSIQKWASEAVAIPYRCPLTGRQTIYVPDFFIQYMDKNGQVHTELIEIKPQNQTLREKVGRNKNNQLQYAKNVAKWRAAQAWCKAQGIKFRVVNEQDIFHNGKKR
jgi:hypothetical protein